MTYFQFSKVLARLNSVKSRVSRQNRKLILQTLSKPEFTLTKQCHLGRTYEDFLEYTAANPDTPVVEIDSVEGRKGGKVLLTVFFRNSNLMLAFLRDRNTARSVTEVFEWLYNILGHEQYCRLFPIILTDRGSEFTDPVSIECTKFGEIRSRVFLLRSTAL